MERRGYFFSELCSPPILRELSQDGGRAYFYLKKLRASLFNDDVSNESNFGHIYLVGKYGQSLSIYSTYTISIYKFNTNEKIRSR